MKIIWLKYKIIIIILIYLLVAGLLMFFLGMPLIHKIKNKSNQIQEDLIDQKIKQSRLSKLPCMKNDLIEYQNKSKDLAVLFDSGNEVEFIEDIEAIADKTGNSIKLKIGDPVNTSKITKPKKNKLTKNILSDITYKKYFPMQINLQGNYVGLVNFIYQLENFKFYINVVSIDSKKQKVVSNINQMNTDSTNGIFSLKSQKRQNEITKNEKKEILNSDIKVLVYLKQ